jgi:hypothetical protein
MTTLQEKVNLAFHKAALKKQHTETATGSTINKKAWLEQAWPELQKPPLENLAQKKFRERGVSAIGNEQSSI